MKNTRGHTEKRELKLVEIRELMEKEMPTKIKITPRLEQPPSEQEDAEWFGVNADSARREYTKDKGHAP